MILGTTSILLTMQGNIPNNAITSRISGTLVPSLRTSSGRHSAVVDEVLPGSPPFLLAAYLALRLSMIAGIPRGQEKSDATILSPNCPVPHSARRPS